MGKRLLCLLLDMSLLCCSSCLYKINGFSQKNPRQIVENFMTFYGTAETGRLAPYTTPSFRNNLPEELWTIQTWEKLREIGYSHLSGDIIAERIEKDKAFILALSRITTVAGETQQKEIYFLIKTEQGWKLNDVIIGEEKLNLGKTNL